MKKLERIYQIDLFRFFAAIGVVLFHYLFRGTFLENVTKVQFPEIGLYFKYGYLGVDLFFIISGFVISLSIQSRSIKKFGISRFTRLYPAYWFSVIFTFLMIFFFGKPFYEAGLTQFIGNLTMFQSFIGIKNIDGVYWTLFIELRFYILIALFLLTTKRLKINIESFILGWIVITIAYLFFGDIFIFKIADTILILKWSSYFIAGMLFHKIYQEKLNLKYGILLLICLGVSIYHAVNRIDVLSAEYENVYFSPLIIAGFILLCYLAMLLVSMGKLQAINSSKMIQFGLLTYPLYLLHQNIGFIMFNLLDVHLNKYLILVIVVVFMLLISYLINKLIEIPLSKYMKDKLSKVFLK